LEKPEEEEEEEKEEEKEKEKEKEKEEEEEEEEEDEEEEEEEFCPCFRPARPAVAAAAGGGAGDQEQETEQEQEQEQGHRDTFMPFMQVHAHLQAAALRLYPGRKLLVPERSSWSPSAASLMVRPLATKDAPDALKFDLAQVWSMHSPSSYVTRYGFRRALTGENQDSPTSELDSSKYPSLEIRKYWESDRPDKFKYRAIMDAEDILKFMLSDFAHKGQYDEIFEREIHWKGPPELVCLMQNQAQSQAQQQAQQPDADAKAPQSAPEAASPRRAFASSCLERMPRPPLKNAEERVPTNALAPAFIGKA